MAPMYQQLKGFKLNRCKSAFAIAVLVSGCSNSAEVVDTTLESGTDTSTEIQNEMQDISEADSRDENDAVSISAGSAAFSSAQESLISRYMAINENCRGGLGGAGQTWHECAKRDLLEPQMRKADLCYGKDGDASGADMTWHVCQSDSLSFADHPGIVPTGSCRIKVDGRLLYEGNCLIDLEQGGSFWVMSVDHSVFGSVDRDSNPPTALVDAEGQSLFNGGDYGTVQRSGACWGNDAVEICAWG